MDALNAVVSAINNVLWSYVLIVVLVGCGIWFTLSTRFVQLRMLPEMIRLLTEGIGHKTEGDAISSFQAFCVSTASRVGVGNIAGVAIAIVTGGPGAVFWMWAIAFLGCATGFVESTLAQIYKLPRGNGKFHGGPAYYIKNALRQPGVAKLFAFLISVTFGLIYVSVQANTIALSAQTAFGIAPIYSAAFLCVLTALVIFGGMSRIAKFTEFLVPIMAGIYLLTAFAIILLNIDKVPAMFALILHDAFSPQAAVSATPSRPRSPRVPSAACSPTRPVKAPCRMPQRRPMSPTRSSRASSRPSASTLTPGLSALPQPSSFS